MEAVAILKSDRGLGSETRFETVTLNEPPKDVVLNYKGGVPFDREAFFIVFDNRTSETHEADGFADERRRWSPGSIFRVSNPG